MALELKTGVPSYQVEDEEGRIHLLLHLPIEDENEDRWRLWRPDQAGFDSKSIFDRLIPIENLEKKFPVQMDREVKSRILRQGHL